MNQILLFEQDFISETTARLTGRRLLHLNEVLGSEKGELIKAGILNGQRGSAAIISIDKNEAVLETMLNEDPPPVIPLTLVAAVQRPKTMKKIMQYAASAGIKSIWFTRTWRVDKSYLESPVLSDKSILENLTLGLEQARDTILPAVQIRTRFRPFVEDELAAIVKDSVAIAAHPAAEKECPRNIMQPCILALGPEGGFIPFEIELLAAHGFTPVTIGERPLRSEFALPSIVGRLF
jgi:RsmE family RNA methyltransferase